MGKSPVGNIIYSILSDDSYVGPVVSDGNSENTFRIFPVRAIESVVLPLITYDVDDSDPQYTMDGLTPLIKQSVKISCLAGDYDSACSMEVDVINAIKISMGVYGGVLVRSIFYKGRAEEESLLQGLGEQVATFVNTVTLDIWYVQPTPAQLVSPFSFGFSSAFQ